MYEGAIERLDRYMIQLGYPLQRPSERAKNKDKETELEILKKKKGEEKEKEWGACGGSTGLEYMMSLLSCYSTAPKLIAAWQQHMQQRDLEYLAAKSHTAPRSPLALPRVSVSVLDDEHDPTPGHENHVQEGEEEPQVVRCRQVLPLPLQVLVLTRRHALYTWRTLHGMRGMLARNILGGLFYGIVYYNNGDKLGDLKSFFSVDRNGILISPYVYNTVTATFSVPLFVVVINMVPIPSMFAMARYCNKEQVCVCCLDFYI